jgi:hypothetical protein
VHEAVKRFEYDVRKGVERGSKSNEFEDSIKEVVGHYSDILQDEIHKKSSAEEADQVARKRLGGLGHIAIQILNCASRKTKGMQRQRRLFWVPALAPLLFIGAQWQGNLAISHLFWAIEKPLMWIFILCGLAYGQAIFMAKTVSWKPLALTYLLASIILIPIYWSGNKADETLDGMTKPQIVAILGQYKGLVSSLGQDKKAIDLIVGTSQKPFEKKYAMAVSTIEHSQTGQFSIDSGAVGAYLLPVSIKEMDDKIMPAQIRLGRTNNAREAEKAWEKIGQDFYVATTDRTSRFNKYQFYVDYKPRPMAYWICGSFIVPLVFFGFFGLFAICTSIALRIWVMRGEWLRYTKV